MPQECDPCQANPTYGARIRPNYTPSRHDPLKASPTTPSCIRHASCERTPCVGGPGSILCIDLSELRLPCLSFLCKISFLPPLFSHPLHLPFPFLTPVKIPLTPPLLPNPPFLHPSTHNHPLHCGKHRPSLRIRYTKRLQKIGL